MTESSPATAHGGTLGSGLNKGSYGVLLLTSVLLFVFYGGALWRTEPSESQVMRFLVSYVAVVPLAAIALVLGRAFTTVRWATAVGTLWAIKLLITAPLYYAFGPGGGMLGETDGGARAPNGIPRAAGSGAPAATGEYQPAEGAFRQGTVRGELLGAGEGSAVVLIESPPPGAPLGEPREIDLRITGRGYERPVYLARTGDSLRVHNDSDRLETVRIVGATRASSNAPVLPTTSATVELPDPGVFRIRSDSSDTLSAILVVVDHPYAAFVDETGRFWFATVPAGEHELTAIGPDGLRSHATVLVRPGAQSFVRLEPLKATETTSK